MNDALLPNRPKNTPRYADACLLALVKEGLNRTISLGGAFGLLHYLDYRSTNDVDAWWDSSATTADKRLVTAVLRQALSAFGAVRERSWGDVVSIELLADAKAIFSFQIAQRSAQLQPSVSAGWMDISLDSLADLIASKMVALIERGAPRDFRDIYATCQSNRTTPRECWQLWRQRQTLTASDCEADRARLAIETHLSRIALHNPLDAMADPAQRQTITQTRNWFQQEFLNALMD